LRDEEEFDQKLDHRRFSITARPVRHPWITFSVSTSEIGGARALSLASGITIKAGNLKRKEFLMSAGVRESWSRRTSSCFRRGTRRVPDVQPRNRETAHAETSFLGSRSAVSFSALAGKPSNPWDWRDQVDSLHTPFAPFRWAIDGDHPARMPRPDSVLEPGRSGAQARQLLKVYYNRYRCHTGLAGITPAQRSGAPADPIANLDSFRGRKHCDGLFQTPSAAWMVFRHTQVRARPYYAHIFSRDSNGHCNESLSASSFACSLALEGLFASIWKEALGVYFQDEEPRGHRTNWVGWKIISRWARLLN
jgi:hypothetical protein